MQKFAEVHFSAQKRLKFAKLLKNIEASSKMLQNKPSKYIHLRTNSNACKIKTAQIKTIQQIVFMRKAMRHNEFKWQRKMN